MSVREVLVQRSCVALVLCALAFAPLFARAQDASSVAGTSRTNAGVEEKVRAYFADAPVMVEIAKCESRFRQFDSAGKALRGGLGGGMIGLFQVFGKIHRNAAAAMGHDIDTPEGNMAYARHLFESQGTDPWLSSFACWGQNVSAEALAPTAEAATHTAGAAMLTKNLSLGVVDGEVRTLQKLLNDNGYRIADSGPGSPGQETDKYGTLTRDAVRSFQCTQGIACVGSEGTTGYGYVGARTRQALLSLASLPSVSAVPAPALASGPSSNADETAAKIAQLQAQIAKLVALIAQLQAAKNVAVAAQ